MNLGGPRRSRGWERGLAVIVGLVLLRAAAQADPVAIRIEVFPQSARIVLTWPSPVTFHTSVEGRELAIQFSHALDAPQMEDLPKQAPAWIEDVSFGYDTMLLRAAREVHYTIQDVGNEVVVTLSLSAADRSRSAEEEAAAQLRLDLLRAQLLAQTGKEGKALESLHRLAGQYPDNTQVLVSLASIEHSLGRWRRADALYLQALQRQPDNEDILQARDDLLREQEPRVRLDTDRKIVPGLQREQIVRFSGHSFLTGSLRVGFVYDQNFVEGNSLQRSSGKTGSFEGIRRRGEIYMQHDSERGARLRGSLFAGASTAGLGFQYAVQDTRGQTNFQIDFRRPYWEFIEGVVDGGVRDRLEIRRQHRLGPRLAGSIAAALNRYGVEGDSNVAKSLALEGSLSYFVLKSKPSLEVQYFFDGESRRSIDIRTDASGVPFSPLPLVSREVHAFEAVSNNDLTRRLRFQGFTGFAWDRLGGSGPFFGVKLTYETRHNLDAEVWFDRRLYFVNTDEKINRVGGYISWRF